MKRWLFRDHPYPVRTGTKGLIDVISRANRETRTGPVSICAQRLQRINTGRAVRWNRCCQQRGQEQAGWYHGEQ